MYHTKGERRISSWGTGMLMLLWVDVEVEVEVGVGDATGDSDGDASWALFMLIALAAEGFCLWNCLTRSGACTSVAFSQVSWASA